MNVIIKPPTEISEIDTGSKKRKIRARGKTISEYEFREYLKHPPKASHSDGFLSLSGIAEPAYSCQVCGFRGFFESETCHRCGSPL